MDQKLSQINTYLILSLRHLGDAVVVAGFINALLERDPGAVIDVLGRAELKDVTEAFCTVREYIRIDLPIFGHHEKSIPKFRDALQSVFALRDRRYDCCINLMGDVRENFIGRIVGAKEVIAPVWLGFHPFKKHIRSMHLPGALTNRIEIPDSIAGYYASIEYFTRQLGLRGLCWPKQMYKHTRQEGDLVIGIHPGASHPSKQWSPEKWKQLIRSLEQKGYRIKIYGAPSEAALLRKEYRAEIMDSAVEVITGEMSGFLQSLSNLDLLVGMDSFSAHAAHALGIPAVVLHGPFDPSVMTPPSGFPLSAGSQCRVFPCYKGQSCVNSTAKYICVQGIEVEAVTNAVDAIISHKTIRPTARLSDLAPSWKTHM